MVEERFPIDTSKIRLLTFYLDEEFRPTKNFMKIKYKYQAAGYDWGNDLLFKMRLGKALDYLPNQTPATEATIQKLDGELIYKDRSLFYHVFYENGLLINGFATNLEGDKLQLYYDFSGLLHKSDPRWPCWESYNDKGEIKTIGYAYFCGGALRYQTLKVDKDQFE